MAVTEKHIDMDTSHSITLNFCNITVSIAEVQMGQNILAESGARAVFFLPIHPR